MDDVGHSALFFVRLVQNHTIARAFTFVVAYVAFEVFAYVIPALWTWFLECLEGIWEGIKSVASAVGNVARSLAKMIWAILCYRVALLVRGTTVGLASWLLYPYILSFLDANDWIGNEINRRLEQIGSEIFLYYLYGWLSAMKERCWNLLNIFTF